MKITHTKKEKSYFIHFSLFSKTVFVGDLMCGIFSFFFSFYFFFEMGDADILAKLSRILETHHLSTEEEENTSIEEILHNISREAGIRIEDEQEEDKSKSFFSLSLSLSLIISYLFFDLEYKILNIMRNQPHMKYGKHDKKKNLF